MMRRSALTVAATVLGLGVCAAAPASAAALGSSYAAAINIQPGSGIAPTVGTTGDLSGLLDFVTPVVNQFVNPLASALSQLPTTAVSDLTSSVNAGLVANSASTAQSAPASGQWPDCSSSSWNSGNCFNVSSTVGGNVPVRLDLGAAQGWAAADGSGSSSAVQVGQAEITGLGVDFGRFGTAQSSISCPKGSSCTATPSFASVSLLGGAVAAKSASDGSLQFSLNGGAYQSLAQLSGTTTVSFNGASANVRASGNALELSVPITLDQLLGQLGLTDTLASLNASDDGSTITADLFIGSVDKASVGQAAGLDVSLGVTANVKISVLGLVDVTLTAGDGSPGNIAGLQLAYTAATNPDGSSGSVVTQPTLD